MSKNKNPPTRKDTSSKARFTRKKVNKKEGVGEYKGVAYESFNELHFLYWVEELMEIGIVESIERAPSYILTEGWVNVYSLPNKRKTQGTPKQQVLLRPSVYTPEFIITWSKKALEKFVWEEGTSRFDKLFIGKKVGLKTCTWIEVKPHFNMRGKTTLFVNNQKFLFKIHGIYVNLVKIPDLFEHTFVPVKYLKTATGKEKKINFEIKTLNEYLTQ